MGRSPCRTLIVLVWVVTAMKIFGVNGYTQTFAVYFDPAEQGTQFLFRDSIPDVPLHILDGTDHFCVQGLWIGFDSTNYEGHFLEVHGDGSAYQCYHMKPFPFRSFRFGGALETEDVGLSVYADAGYQGVSVTEVTGDQQAALSGRSIILSSGSDWELFESQTFEGKSICVTVESWNLPLGLQGYSNVSTLGLAMVGSAMRRQNRC